MVEPITPDQVIDAKRGFIPDEVLAEFNYLITKNFDGHSSVVRQADIVARLQDAGIGRQRIFDDHLLDVEDIYRDAGWVVEFDKPGYNETYPASFTFRKKK